MDPPIDETASRPFLTEANKKLCPRPRLHDVRDADRETANDCELLNGDFHHFVLGKEIHRLQSSPSKFVLLLQVIAIFKQLKAIDVFMKPELLRAQKLADHRKLTATRF